MKILMGAGGTGGHIIPALAVGLELRKRSWDVAFTGNKCSMEETLVTKNEFTFFPIHVQKLYRELTWQHIKFPFLLVKSLWNTAIILRRFKPDAVFCTGGFVSAPLVFSCRLFGYILYLQDGNSFPGLTTRLSAKYARHVFIASDSARQYLKNADTLITGNPIMPYQKLNKSSLDWSMYNLSQTSTKLLVIGGSQGSVIINQSLEKIAKELLTKSIEIIWQTGKRHLKPLQQKFSGVHGIHMFDFTDRMNDYYQIADLAISRAGALSIAELTEHRIPALYIPLPSAAENHQYKNAMDQIHQGVAIILEQRDLTPESLQDNICEMLNKLANFRQHLDALPANQATVIIADIIEQETHNK